MIDVDFDLEGFSVFGRNKTDGLWYLLSSLKTEFNVRGKPERRKFLFLEYNYTPRYNIYPDKEKTIRLAWDAFLSEDYQDVMVTELIGYDFGMGYETFENRIWLNGKWITEVKSRKSDSELMIF